MSRSVKVTLEADVGKFTVPVIAAKEETEKLDRKIEALNRDLDKTPAAATRAAAAMKLLGGDTKGVGQQLNDLGPQATNSLELIEKKLEDARLRVKTFADEFNKTGSADSFNLWQKAVSDVSGLEKLQKSLTSALPQMKALASGAEAADAAMKLFNNDLTGGAKSLDQINVKLKDTEKALKSAAKEFNNTGSAASLQQVFQLSADKKSLEKLQTQLKTSLEGAGKDGGISLMQGVAYGAGAVAPIVLPAVGALILAGLGLGVIGAGIIGQLGSQQVKNAFATFKTDAGATFKDVTSPFGGVITRELSAADDLVQKVAPELRAMFDKAAPAADKLFQGVNGFVEKSLPGLNKGLDGAVIVVDELGRDLPAMGKAIGDAFAGVAEGAQGEAHALHDLLTVVDQLIVSGGRLAGTSGNMYEQMRSIATLKFDSPNLSMHSLQGTFDAITTGGIGPLIKHFLHLGGAQDDAAKSALVLKTNMEVAAASIDIAGGKAMSASDQYGMLISQLHAVNNTADKVAGAMTDAIINPMLAADRAAGEFDKSLITLGDTLEANGGHLSDHVKQLKKTETGAQQNKDAILAVVQANLQEYDSQIAVGVAASDAAAKYDENTKALEDQLRAAGWTQAAIDGLIGKYRNVPDKVNTAIAIDGLTSAIDDLNDLIRLINGLHSKTITIAEEHTYTYQDPSQYYHGHGATGGIRTAATGTLVMPRNPGTLLIGEPQTGGEALIPLRGISQMRAAALGQVAMDGYGLDVVPRGYRGAQGGGSGGPQTLQLAATFVLPSGEVVHQQLITYALNTGRQPAQLFPAVSR